MPKTTTKPKQVTTKPYSKQLRGDLKAAAGTSTGDNKNNNNTRSTTRTKGSRQKSGASMLQSGADFGDKSHQQEPAFAKQQRELPNRRPGSVGITNNTSTSNRSSNDNNSKDIIVSVLATRKQYEQEIMDGSEDNVDNESLIDVNNGSSDDANQTKDKCAAKQNDGVANAAMVIDNASRSSQKLSTLTFEEYNCNEDQRETEEGLNMFIDNRPFSEICTVLKNSIYTIVEERLFPTSKFYVDDDNVDEIVGFVMNNVGLHGRSMKHKQARSKWWCTVRNYIKSRTNEYRQLVYD